jgi:hypothetical protein
MNNLNSRLNRPEFARPGAGARVALSFVAFLISGALLGGLLGLFEMQSSSAAMARATLPSGKASSVLAEREQRPGADPSGIRRSVPHV